MFFPFIGARLFPMTPSPQRSEEWRLRPDLTLDVSQPFDVGMAIRNHALRQWIVPRLSAFDSHPPQAPCAVEVSNLKRSD